MYNDQYQLGVVIQIKENKEYFANYHQLGCIVPAENGKSRVKPFAVSLPYTFDQEMLKSLFDVPVYFILAEDGQFYGAFKAVLKVAYNRKVNEHNYLKQFSFFMSKFGYYRPSDSRFKSCVVVDNFTEIDFATVCAELNGVSYWNHDEKSFLMKNFLSQKTNRVYLSFNESYLSKSYSI